MLKNSEAIYPKFGRTSRRSIPVKNKKLKTNSNCIYGGNDDIEILVPPSRLFWRCDNGSDRPDLYYGWSKLWHWYANANGAWLFPSGSWMHYRLPRLPDRADGLFVD